MKIAALALALFAGASQASSIFAPSTGRPPSYGSLYQAVATTMALNTTNSQWQDSVAGPTSGAGLVVASVATDSLTIGASGSGTYWVSFDATIAFSSAADITAMGISVNGATTYIQSRFKASASAGNVNFKASGLLYLKNADAVTLIINAGGSTNGTFSAVNLAITREDN